MSDDTKALMEWLHGGVSESRSGRMYKLALDTIERLQRELAEARTDGAAYHRAMSLLLSMKMGHGLCAPRSRRACTHCNARDDLAAMVMAYRGPRVVLSEEDWK